MIECMDAWKGGHRQRTQQQWAFASELNVNWWKQTQTQLQAQIKKLGTKRRRKQKRISRRMVS